MMKLMTMQKIVLVFLLLPLGGSAAAETVAGWVEPVMLMPQQINFMAKLDTGARNSSLNSQDIEILENQDTPVVRFKIKSREGHAHTFELPLEKYSTIKRHFGKSQQRPVVTMEICLGNTLKKVLVNLVDRSGFNYQLLLGRSYLSPEILVDSGRTEITAPNCSK